MSANNCSMCKWFVANPMHNVGGCHRFPQVSNKGANDFCGEWASAYAEPVPDMLALPVVEMPKKRGRPAKEQQ